MKLIFTNLTTLGVLYGCLPNASGNDGGGVLTMTHSSLGGGGEAGEGSVL